jgi:prepilin-type N-terminal cleavage/methylation domain-containing protein
MHPLTRGTPCSLRPRNHPARSCAVPGAPPARRQPPRGAPRAIAARAGFTLVEILMVIIILGILMALLLPAINRAKITANEARVVSEIKQLDAAIAAFKVQYGVEPPSKISIYTTSAGWSSDAYSSGLIKRIWPQFDFTMGTGSGTTFPSTWGAQLKMNSGECLMFFLGGIIQNGAPTGFAKNPAYPFSPPGVVPNRTGPFLEFDPGRIKDSDGNGILEFFDPLPNQTAPYLYFSSYEGNGYRVAGTITNIELPLDSTGTNFTTLRDVYRASNTASTPPATPQATATGSQLLPAQKPQTWQIISPGYDASYGLGGVYNTSLTNNGLQNMNDYDNLTNFAGGRLKP